MSPLLREVQIRCPNRGGHELTLRAGEVTVKPFKAELFAELGHAVFNCPDCHTSNLVFLPVPKLWELRLNGATVIVLCDRPSRGLLASYKLQTGQAFRIIGAGQERLTSEMHLRLAGLMTVESFELACQTDQPTAS